MWTIHQPPSRVTSISKLDIGPSLARRSGSSPKSTRSAKRRFNDSSGHASRGRCGGDKALGDLVFPGPDGGYLPRPKSSGGWFAAAVRRAEVQAITPHD